MKTDEPTFCVADIVRRAKEVLGLRFDTELAQHLGVSRSTLCNWISRNSLDFGLVLGKLQDYDYNWLLTGRGTPRRPAAASVCHDSLAEGEVDLMAGGAPADSLTDRYVTLYDVSAAANLHTMLEDRPQYALGRIFIPNVPRCDGAVYVSGDSMYPLLKSGDIVGFRAISRFDDVIYGETYLVSFERGGDEYLAVKFVNRSEQPGCIRLVSYNTHHEPMDIPLENIHFMGIVKFSIRKNMMM